MAKVKNLRASGTAAGEQSDSLKTRRDMIHIATGATSAFGAAALAWPLVAHLRPAAGNDRYQGPEIDLSDLKEGEQLKILWFGKPVFIRHRTAQDIEAARRADKHILPDLQIDEDRLVAGLNGVKNPKYLVIVGLCTHFGCVPVGEQGDYGGWYCPCHGAHFDTSGRVRKGPAPKNMTVPPYEYTSETTIRILHPHDSLARKFDEAVYRRGR